MAALNYQGQPCNLPTDAWVPCRCCRFHTILSWSVPPPEQKQQQGMRVIQTKWTFLPKGLSANLKCLEKWFVSLSRQARNISLSLTAHMFCLMLQIQGVCVSHLFYLADKTVSWSSLNSWHMVGFIAFGVQCGTRIMTLCFCNIYI